MSAPMFNMSVFPRFGRLWTYSRITCARFHQKRCLQEAVSLPEAKYFKDKEGNLVGPQATSFPNGLQVDPDVESGFAKDTMRYSKKHPGIMHFDRAPALPRQLVKNARRLLAENDLIKNANFEAEVKHLQEVFLRRQPPVEEMFIKEQLQILKEKILAEEITSNNIDFEDLNDIEKTKLQQRATSIASKIFKKSCHAWKEIEYKNHTALVYMAARLAPNYTVLLKIFDEVQKLDRDFLPEAVLNVGSGIGSAVWAANTIWAEKVFEYYNVDTSSYMNDLARKLLAKDTSDPLHPTIHGVHFRQFVPSPEHNENSFPLVVSAYLLMELPSLAERLNFISLLCELTKDYLVFVEHGTMAGYRLIMEARNILKQIGNEHPEEKGHIFAPCTHDLECPKLQMKKLPCTFPVEYRHLNVAKDKGQGDVKGTERYSYLVFKKGPKQPGKRYSRVTRAVQKPTNSHCQLCCPDGSLRYFVITESKPSRALFKCSKKCEEGDFLPFLWPDVGSEAQDCGTKDHKSGTDEHISSTEELKSGTDEHISSTEEQESGTDEHISSTEELECGTDEHISSTEEEKKCTDEKRIFVEQTIDKYPSVDFDSGRISN